MPKQTQLYPLLFRSDQFRPYVWGGQKLRSFVRPAYTGQPIAELWAIADRPEDDTVSIIANGPLEGQSLHEVLTSFGSDLLGSAQPTKGKFPLLVKLLDAADTLSVQVHPPATVAKELGGEPKSECWYVLEGTSLTAKMYVGLKPGLTPDSLRAALANGRVADCLQTLRPTAGQLLSVPSGRLHTLGKGCFVLEVQENSNTTYRVFDWNRVDKKTGKPRELHVEQALRSIDFQDNHPDFEHHPAERIDTNIRRPLLYSPLFSLEAWQIRNQQTHRLATSFDIVFAEKGTVEILGAEETIRVEPFHFCLLPWAINNYTVRPVGHEASYVRILNGASVI